MVPDKLLIIREEDEHTFYTGKISDRFQFWGYNTFAFESKPIGNPQNGETLRWEYIVLHIFDVRGKHLNTEFWYGGITSEFNPRSISEKIEGWLSQKGAYIFSNIEVELFSVMFNGIIFGLIPDFETQSVELMPSSTISFMEPWDGEYYT